MLETTGLAIFCEDIRLELGGKVSYMGIYGNDMVVAGQRPVILPKLCIAAHIRIPSRIGTAHLKVSVLREQSGATEELMAVEGNMERPPDLEVTENSFTQATVHLHAVPFEISGDCLIRVRAYVDDAECKLGTMPIRFEQSPE